MFSASRQKSKKNIAKKVRCWEVIQVTSRHLIFDTRKNIQKHTKQKEKEEVLAHL